MMRGTDQVCILNSICEFIIDCEHKTAPIQEEGYPSIRTPNIGRGRLILEGVNRVSEETYNLWTQRAIPREGDLILAREAPVGNVAIIQKNLQVCLGQRTVLIRPNKSKVDPNYLLYLLLGDEIQGKIQSLSGGATVAHLNMGEIRKMKLPTLPPLTTQQKIAAILSAYDDLIENNTRRIKILEEMAQAIYREWFVNFRFPGHVGMEMVESELGPVPEGWEVRKLFDIADVTYGFPFKSNIFTSEPTDKPVIRIRNILNDYTDNFTTESVSEKYLVKNGDLLVGMDGDFHMGKWAGDIAYLNQRVVRFRPKEKLSPYYLYLALEKPIQYFDSTITGTTVAHLSDRDLKSIRLLIPDVTLVKKVNETFDSLFNLEIMLKIKNTNLRRTRDLLLPKLISGELDVSELDIEIPAA
ncbi:MAG: restriction endonuclease subunit S [Methanoregula sp.]|nr:restriction endonuclease subunit S [Methanoregula sp.]